MLAEGQYLTSEKVLMHRLLRSLCTTMHLPKGDRHRAKRLPRKSPSIGGTSRGNVCCVVANNLKSKIVCVGSSGKCTRFCAIWTPHCGRKREMLCLFACKSKHFLSIKPTFLATKSSCISNSAVRGRKLADFLSLLPLFLRRARSF